MKVATRFHHQRKASSVFFFHYDSQYFNLSLGGGLDRFFGFYSDFSLSYFLCSSSTTFGEVSRTDQPFFICDKYIYIYKSIHQFYKQEKQPTFHKKIKHKISIIKASQFIPILQKFLNLLIKRKQHNIFSLLLPHQDLDNIFLSSFSFIFISEQCFITIPLNGCIKFPIFFNFQSILYSEICLSMLEVTDQTIHLLFKHPTFINYLNEQINQNVQSTAEFENYTQFSLKRLAREVNDRIFHHLRQQISEVSKDLEEALVAKTQAQLEGIRKEVQSIKKELNLEMEQFKNRELNPENQTSLVGTFPIQMTDVETKKATKKDLLQNRRTLADSLLELSCILGKQKILDLQPQSELSQHNISQNKLTELENLTFIKGKVVEFEADYSNLLKQINQWHIEKKENIEQNYLLRQNIEERLETHFQGLWKVVSNLQIKFIKYEQILHQKGIV